MRPQIPHYIFNIKITNTTSPEVLEILRRLLVELHGYASASTQKEFTTIVSQCVSRLRQIERQLHRQDSLQSLPDLFAPPAGNFDGHPLSSLSISQLDCLYRQRPRRIQARIAAGLEPVTRYLESQIAAELASRKAADIIEQLKIDYCLTTHRIEMLRMARLLGLPYEPESKTASTPPSLTPETILAEINRLRTPHTLSERESLVRIADCAIDNLRLSSDLQSLAPLAAELIELQRRNILRIPAWVNQYLSKAINQWTRTPRVPDTQMVLPLLTSAIATRDWPLQRRAQRIINRCYRACLAGTPTPADILTATTFSSFIPRFNPRLLPGAV